MIRQPGEELTPGYAYFDGEPYFPCTCFMSDTWNGAFKPFFRRDILDNLIKNLGGTLVEENAVEVHFTMAGYEEQVYIATKMPHGLGYQITPYLMFEFDRLEVSGL